MKTITKVTDTLCTYISYLSMTAMVLIMALMTIDVFLRQVFDAPILGAYEITTMIMSILIFSSWSYTQTQHGHIHVTLLIEKLPMKSRFFCFGLVSVFSTGTMGTATCAIFQQAIKLHGNRAATSVLFLPHWPFVLLEGIAIAIFTFVLAVDAVKAILAIFKTEYAEEVMSYW